MLFGLFHMVRFGSLCKGNSDIKFFKMSQRFKFGTSLVVSSTKQSSDFYLPDGQLRYSTNKKWHAAMNFLQKPRDIPKYQYPIVLMSVFVCMIYFCFLREENELDDILSGKVSLISKNGENTDP